MREDSFQSLQWGYGPGLLECQECGALVLPDSAEKHGAWHSPETDQ